MARPLRMSLELLGAGDVLLILLGVAGLIGTVLFGGWYLLNWLAALLCTPIAAAARTWFGRPTTVVARSMPAWNRLHLIAGQPPPAATRYEATAADTVDAETLIDRAAADIAVHGRSLSLHWRSGQPLDPRNLPR
jgi:hypothetical protein